jgi:hypothetical protein
MTLDSLTEQFKKLNVKLTGGVFGKTFTLLMVLTVCVGGVALKLDSWFVLCLILPLLALIGYAVKRVFDFADKNPAEAILDGGQFVAHEQIIQQSKHSKISHERVLLEPENLELDHELPPAIVQAEPLAIEAPDAAVEDGGDG